MKPSLIKKTRYLGLWTMATTATAALVLAVSVNADNHPDSSASPLQVVPMEPAPAASQSAPVWAPSMGFADLIESVSPAVVHVATSGFVQRSRGRDFRFPPGWEEFFRDFQSPRDSEEESDDSSRESTPLGIGSGFLISANGYVVTNHHVISRADEITVTLADDTEYLAELVGSDPKTDLALLKLENASDLPYVAWGDDDQSRVGDWVVAIGNPFGLGGSASTGIISARGRDIRSGPYDDYIQVDAAINRGNSGGPLFNIRGEVIGINTAIYSPNGGSVGIGFSIPASLAKGIIRQLQDEGEVERAWIGVRLQPMDRELAQSLGRDDDAGALIISVEPNAPAERAGLQVGDIILSFNGIDIDEMRDLPRIVADVGVGLTFDVTVWRDGSEQTLSILTERFPDDEELAGQRRAEPSDPTIDKEMGAELGEITDFDRERYRIADSVQGVVLRSVQRGGLAARNGLRTGDVISRLDGQDVTEPAQVSGILQSARDDEKGSVSMLLIRAGSPSFLAFNIEE